MTYPTINNSQNSMERSKFVESPTRPENQAVEVVVGNDPLADYAGENCEGEKAIRIVVDNSNTLICESGVFNLFAGVPLVINLQIITEICDVNFFKDNGKQIFISYKNLNDSIEICSNKNMINMTYKVEGKKACGQGD